MPALTLPNPDAAGTYMIITEIQGHLPTMIHTSRNNAPATAREHIFVCSVAGMPDATRVMCTGRAPYFATLITDVQATHYDAEVTTFLHGGVNTQWNMFVWYW